MVIEEDEGSPPSTESAPRIVRLPILPRDAAIGEGRPLSDTAREHGGVFHQWIQACIDDSRPTPVGRERRALGRVAATLAGLWRRLRRRR